LWRGLEEEHEPTSSPRGVKLDTEEGLAAARNGQDTCKPRTKLLSAPSHMNAKTWRQGKNPWVLDNRTWLHTGKKSRHENLQSRSIYLTDGKNNREETSLRTNETKEKLRSEVNTTHDAKTIFP
jgi:hypothetical protein